MIEKFGVTKGPWVLMLSEHDDGKGKYRAWDLEGQGNIIIDPIDMGILEMTEPDARLIAAAPEMAEALIGFVDWWQKHYEIKTEDMGAELNPLLDALRVLEKALGLPWEEIKGRVNG
jgi:hypothetical protein